MLFLTKYVNEVIDAFNHYILTSLAVVNCFLFHHSVLVANSIVSD